MRLSRSERMTGQIFLIALVLVTLLPFVSMLSAALQPRGTVPTGLAWPSDPQWGNFADAFTVANMGALLRSSVLIVAGVIFGFELGTFFSVAMIGLAGAAILYDTSNVLHHYPEDRYVAASLELFASVALMFWYVLQLFMSRD